MRLCPLLYWRTSVCSETPPDSCRRSSRMQSSESGCCRPKSPAQERAYSEAQKLFVQCQYCSNTYFGYCIVYQLLMNFITTFWFKALLAQQTFVSDIRLAGLGVLRCPEVFSCDHKYGVYVYVNIYIYIHTQVNTHTNIYTYYIRYIYYMYIYIYCIIYICICNFTCLYTVWNLLRLWHVISWSGLLPEVGG